MKYISRFLWILLLIYCGIVSAFPTNKESAIKDISSYLSESGEDLLKVYNANGTWSNFKDVGKQGNVYVLSHGIGDTYDTGWIKNTANAILAKDKNAQILSVNWDKYSNLITKTNTDTNGNVSYSSVIPNPTASTWINGISQMVSDELASKGVSNVKSAIGHSYGAHILAGSVSDSYSQGTKFNRLIALDPAEESLTFTGDQNGNTTTMFSSDKKSKNWGINDKTTVEVYKSSSFLGNDIPLGDYNYIIASTGTFSPRSVLGDWGGFNMPAGKDGKHALSTHWISDQIEKSTSTEIGGWFNNQTVLGEGSGKWHGLVNTDSCKMEYSMKTSQSGWGDAVFEYACLTDDWSGTILNSNYQTQFQTQYSSGEGTLDSISQTQTLYNSTSGSSTTSTTTVSSAISSTEEAVKDAELSEETKAQALEVYSNAAKAIEAANAIYEVAMANSQDAMKPVLTTIMQKTAMEMAEEANRQVAELIDNDGNKQSDANKTVTTAATDTAAANKTAATTADAANKTAATTADAANKNENADISDEDKAKINKVYTDAAQAMQSLTALGEQAMNNSSDAMKPYIAAMIREQVQAMAEEAQRQASDLLDEAKAKVEAANAKNNANGTTANGTANGTTANGTANGTTANGTANGTAANGTANGTVTNNANDTATTVTTAVDVAYNAVKDSLNTESFADWCDKTVTSAINAGKDTLVTAATTAVDGVLDKLNVGYGSEIAVDIVKKGANELISNSGNTIASAVQNVYNDLRKDFSVDSAIESIKNNVKTATSELWTKGKETVTSTFKNLFSWDTLESVIGKGIDTLLEKNPTLKTICSALGLKDGKSIVNIGKELFTAVKGLLNGKSLVDVLKDSPALQNLIKNGIKSGINYLVNKFLTPLVNKAITKVSGWLNNLLGNKLGISITETEISTMLTSAYNEGIKLAEKDISDFIDTKASVILGTSSTDNKTTSSGKTDSNTTIFERPKQGEEIKNNQ
jgi:hypothetical protein